MIKNIGIDLDGIQFNWSREYSKIIRELGGEHCPIIDESDIKGWRWSDWYPASQELLDLAWQVMTEKESFWENIEVLHPDQVHYMCEHLNNNPQVAVYFITSRVTTRGDTLIRQTIKSLEKIGWTSPQVIVSFQKGTLARALDLKYFLDDRAENCVEVSMHCPDTKVFILDKPHNRIMHDKNFRLTRITRLEEFTNVVIGKTT
jgi:hypothetical protein